MDRALIQEYLEKTAMEPAQALALSRIFGEMATKSDLIRLTGQMAELDVRLTGQMAELDARLTGRMAELDARLTGQMAQMESRLTWRIIAIVGFFATVSTLLTSFMG